MRHDDRQVGQGDQVDEGMAVGDRGSSSISLFELTSRHERRKEELGVKGAYVHVRLFGEVKVGGRVVGRLGRLEVAHDLLEQRQTREETNDLLLGPLDPVLLRRDWVTFARAPACVSSSLT